MDKTAAKKLHKAIVLLANDAFTLELHEEGKRLLNCAGHLRNKMVVTEERKSG